MAGLVAAALIGSGRACGGTRTMSRSTSTCGRFSGIMPAARDGAEAYMRAFQTEVRTADANRRASRRGVRGQRRSDSHGDDPSIALQGCRDSPEVLRPPCRVRAGGDDGMLANRLRSLLWCIVLLCSLRGPGRAAGQDRSDLSDRRAEPPRIHTRTARPEGTDRGARAPRKSRSRSRNEQPFAIRHRLPA